MRNGETVEVGGAALGGAIAAGIAGLVRGVIGGIVSLVFTTSADLAASLAALSDAGFDVPPEAYDMLGSAGSTAGVGVIGIITSACGALIFGAILGAIGAAIYGATQGNKHRLSQSNVIRHQIYVIEKSPHQMRTLFID